MRSRRDTRSSGRDLRRAGDRGAGEQAPAQRRTSAGDPPLRAAALYALPPDEFVPAREALARELAAAGDPLAAATRKLRRPVGIAWVLNHLALAERQAVGTLLAAGEQLRRAQSAALEGDGAGALREAEQEVRDAARLLRLAAGPVLERARGPAAPAVMARIEVLLRALATADRDVRERFAKGLLDREPEVGGETFGGLPGPKSPAERLPAKARAAAQERRREEAAARARTREQAKTRERAARELTEAEQALGQRRAAFEDAQRRLDRARAELESAEGEAKRRRELVDRLGGGTPFTRRGPPAGT